MHTSVAQSMVFGWAWVRPT